MNNTIKEITIPKAFQGGWLINFRARKWGGTSKADEDRFGDDFPKEFFKAMQDLLDDEGRELLNSLNTVKNSCNAVLNGSTIQFPIHGFRFLKENLEGTRLIKISDSVEEHSKQYFQIAEEFISKFEDLKQQYKVKVTALGHPEDYKPWKYPSEARLRNTFQFTLQVFEFKGPGEELKKISPDVYKNQMEEIKRNCQEMGEQVTKAFGLAMVERLNVLADQCNGKGNLNNRTIDSVNNLIEKFEDLYKDFVDEKKIKTFTSDIKEYLEDVDSDLLKADDDFRSLIASKAKEVSDTIQKMPAIGQKPSRKIDL